MIFLLEPSTEVIKKAEYLAMHYAGSARQSVEITVTKDGKPPKSFSSLNGWLKFFCSSTSTEIWFAAEATEDGCWCLATDQELEYKNSSLESKLGQEVTLLNSNAYPPGCKFFYKCLNYGVLEQFCKENMNRLKNHDTDS